MIVKTTHLPGIACNHSDATNCQPSRVAKSAVHGVVSGALTVAQGGSFMQGFAVGAIGAAAGHITGETGLANIEDAQGMFVRTAIAGSAGGIASELTGGKFENGFLTAATAHLFNQEDALGKKGWFGKFYDDHLRPYKLDHITVGRLEYWDAEDRFGHYWIEVDGKGYGWWPNRSATKEQWATRSVDGILADGDDDYGNVRDPGVKVYDVYVRGAKNAQIQTNT